MLSTCESPTWINLAVNKRLALVVEDESLVAGYLSDMLTDLGFQPYIAQTAAEALELVKVGVFTVAFVDLALPDQSGLEVISEIKDSCPEMPIVIASAYGEMAGRDMADNVNKIPVLTKPYDQRVLSSLLKTLGFHLLQST